MALGLIAAGTSPGAARADGASCLQALERLGVDYRPVERPGIDIGVEVRGGLGGVDYSSSAGEALVLDCSLVYSLARVGPLLRGRGIERVSYSSAYQRRNIRGTRRPSRHSFGLAIDIHGFGLAGGDSAAVKADYEQGLGDASDCVGEPLTRFGRILRSVECEVIRSGQFRVLLTPDYDPDHYNHFHLEAVPWRERAESP